MPPKQSFWFHIGYTLEQLRNISTETAEKVRISEDTTSDRTQNAPENLHTTWSSLLEGIPTTDILGAISTLMKHRKPIHMTTFGNLAKAGASGALSALITSFLNPKTRESADLALDRETRDRLLAGIRRGLLYSAILEPKVPGPTVLKGALYGTIEYAAKPAGGLSQLISTHKSPSPFSALESLLEGLDSHDHSYIEHIVFGVLLALLYGSSASSNGILEEDKER